MVDRKKGGDGGEVSGIVSVEEASNGTSESAKAGKPEAGAERRARTSEALLRLAGNLCTTFDIARIEKLFLMTFAGRLGLKKAAVYLLSPGGGEFGFGYELGGGPAPLPPSISRMSPFARRLEKENGVVFIDRYSAGLQTPSEIDIKILSDMGRGGFTHALALGSSGDRLGILFFGGKADGSALNDYDRELAAGIARIAEIAIRNAFEYQKCGREIRKSEEFARVRREVILGNAEEIRTPLSVMKSSLWSLDPDDAGTGLLVGMARDAMKRMESKLEQLLSICEIDTRETPLTLEKADAASLVEDTMREFIPELEEKCITVTMNDGTSGTNIFMDPSKMKIALRMIVENSIRAVERGGRIEINTLLSHEGPGPEDGIELSPWDGEAVSPDGAAEAAETFPGCAALDALSREIESHRENRGPFLVFRIRDDGAGIPRGEIAGLSLPFRKGSNGGREWLGRPGTGLTVAQNIVSGHGGKILCESREGSGATFSVWLPSAF
ncbi:MAG: HAMP domain-containing histidine kinase [Candidatus Krumholzibacteria bacterium]|nr:HAMP domain-containing histidine kinase [Candidatus Krumholzibacteria bacterium]